MAEGGLSVNNVVMTVVALSVGIVIIGSVLAPLASDVMNTLTTNFGDSGSTWSSLVGVVVVISIVGLILVAVNSYTRKN